MKIRIHNFTLIEILLVTAIISTILGLSLATLQGARDQARFGRWLAYSANMKAEPSLIAYYNFQDDSNAAVLKNQALGFNITQYDQRKVDASIYKPQWSKGRWKNKGALRGNGVDSYAMIGSDNKINYMSQEFSLELWFYLTNDESCTLFHTIATINNPVAAPANAPKGIAKKFEPVDVDIINVELYNTKVVIDYVSDVTFKTNPNNRQGSGGGYAWGTLVTTADISTQRATFNHKFSINKWYYLVLTYSYTAQKLYLYVNGEKVGESTETDPLVYLFQKTYIGGDNSAGCSINGLIDEVGIYNRALTPYDIKAHYSMGAPR